MKNSDDDAAKNEQGGIFSPVLIGMMLLGAFATFAMAIGAWNLLEKYDSL